MSELLSGTDIKILSDTDELIIIFVLWLVLKFYTLKTKIILNVNLDITKY